MLQPLDLLVCLKLVAWGGRSFGYKGLAEALHIGLGSAHRSVERAMDAGLLTPERMPHRAALKEFVLYGVRYAFFVKPGEPTRGMPTAHAAPPLTNRVTQSSDIPVWPDPLGSTRGYTVEPLHKAAPSAARDDPALYELLALVDALRIGRARERQLAQDELAWRLGA